MAKNSKMGYPSGITELLSVFVKRPPRPAIERRSNSTEELDYGDFVWIDMQDPTRRELADLGEKYQLQPFHVDKSIESDRLSRLEVEKDYLFLLFHFPHDDVHSWRLVNRQVIVFLGKGFLVTIHDSKSQTIRRCFEDMRDSPNEGKTTPAKMLLNLIGHLLEDTKVLTDSLTIDLDKVEVRVFENQDSDARKISQLRQRIVRIRRTLATQKQVLEDLDDVIDKFTGERLGRLYTANTNTSIKLWESVEEARETIEIYKDADFTSSQEQTNRILAILTLIFTLSIPTTIVGSIYGMNVNLPGGLETGPWTFWGTYTTFILAMMLSIGLAAWMYLYFKRKRWF